jgi:hypothetical protein
MAVSSKAAAAEIAAFNKVSKILKGSTAFAKPAGFEAGFPDFGFRVDVGGKKVDLHIEYKADAKAQMGSMRDWVFDGSRFMTPDVSNQEKMDLLEMMNSSPEAIKNGQRLLKDLKKHADSKINSIASSTMNIIRDNDERREKLTAFAKATDSFQIAKINNTSLGNSIISHYKKKFKSSRKADANASVLIMMIGNKMWLVDKTPTFNAAVEAEIAKYFGATKIPSIGPLQAALEVRIQPRGLSAPGKRVSIDVMASFRLSGAISGGITV